MRYNISKRFIYGLISVYIISLLILRTSYGSESDLLLAWFIGPIVHFILKDILKIRYPNMKLWRIEMFSTIGSGILLLGCGVYGSVHAKIGLFFGIPLYFIMAGSLLWIAIREKDYENLPYLLLSTTIATTDGSYSVVSVDSFPKGLDLTDIQSSVGHEGLAEAFDLILGFPKGSIQVNREPTIQEIGQKALILKLKGRLPQGVTDLSLAQVTEIGYDLKVMTRLS